MSELPDDLADLERRLAARPRPQPPARFRQRLLATVRDNLQRDRRSVSSGWRYAAALAATVLLCANWSMSAALNQSWSGNTEEVRGLAVTVARLRQFDPEMSEQEARRQALLLQARAQLVPLPPLEQLVRKRELPRLEPR